MIIHMDTDKVHEYTCRMLQQFSEINELLDSYKNRIYAIPWSGLTRESFVIDFGLVVGKLSAEVEAGISLSQRVQHEIDEWLSLDQSNADKYRELISQIVKVNPHPNESSQVNSTTMSREELTEWWKTATLEEKEEYLRSIYKEVCRSLGITPIPFSFEDLPDNDGDLRGGFYDVEMKIRIDSDNVNTDSPFALIETIAHETRHQFQDNCVRMFNKTGEIPEGVTPIQIAAWELDRGSLYVSPEENAFLYWIQPVEVDARGFGADFVSNMFGDHSSGNGGGGGGGGAW
jgi:hypothetical protein